MFETVDDASAGLVLARHRQEGGAVPIRSLSPEQAADHVAIVDTIHAYSHAIDDKDLDLFLDCFTEDGVWTYRTGAEADPSFRIQGRAALADWYAGHHRAFPLGRENHMTLHTRVTLDGDRARATSFYFVVRDYPDGLRVNTTGRYLDELVRCEDGAWRIAERQGIGQMPHQGFRALRAQWVGAG
jgi:ketosteroid isomerase-like protein